MPPTPSNKYLIFLTRKYTNGDEKIATNAVILFFHREAPRNAEAFRDFVAFGFSSMKVNLKKGYTNVFGHVQFLRLATDHGFDASAKPTDLTFKQWLGIFHYFLDNVEKFRQIKTKGAYEKLLAQQKSLQKIHRTRTARNWRGSK